MTGTEKRAKDKIHAFLTNPENKIAIDIRFEKLKANFEMAPSKETAAREKALSSLANIVLLFVQAKLNEVLISYAWRCLEG